MAVSSKLPYAAEPEMEDSEGDESEPHQETRGLFRHHYKPSHKRTHCYIALATILNVLLLLGNGIWAAILWRSDGCSERDHSSYSPLFDRLDIKRSPVRMNNTFWPDRRPSVFQMRPSAEVDEAWRRVSDTRAISITADEVRRLGYDPGAVWPWPEADAGPDAYMGLVDVFHQAHCLDSMRRAAFPEYYGDVRAAFADGPFPFEDHLLHCQFVLLRSILCHADAEVVVFQKVQGFRAPFANFAVEKQCRNWDDILRWKEAHEVVPRDLEGSRRTPDGIQQVAADGLAVPFEETGDVSYSVF